MFKQYKKQFPIKNGQLCPSTHGAAGYCAGDYWDNGSIICSLCGYRIENPPSTGAYFGQPTYPDFIKDIPSDKTSIGLRTTERSKNKWYQFWKKKVEE